MLNFMFLVETSELKIKESVPVTGIVTHSGEIDAYMPYMHQFFAAIKRVKGRWCLVLRLGGHLQMFLEATLHQNPYGQMTA